MPVSLRAVVCRDIGQLAGIKIRREHRVLDGQPSCQAPIPALGQDLECRFGASIGLQQQRWCLSRPLSAVARVGVLDLSGGDGCRCGLRGSLQIVAMERDDLTGVPSVGCPRSSDSECSALTSAWHCLLRGT